MTAKPVPTAEEETRIREQLAQSIARHPECATLWPALMLNALDAARAEIAAVDAILDGIQAQPNNGEPARRLRNLVFDRDDWREMALKGCSPERVIVPREGTRRMADAWSAAHRAGGDPSECLAAALKAGDLAPLPTPPTEGKPHG